MGAPPLPRREVINGSGRPQVSLLRELPADGGNSKTVR